MALLILLALSCKILPVHKGPLLEAAGVAGVGLTTIRVVAAEELHAFMIVLTE